MRRFKIGFIRSSIFIFTIMVLNVNYVDAQKVMDSILMEQSKLNAINQFKHLINENALIYTGNEYVEKVSLESMHQIILGTPFFINDSFINGTVNYDGIDYQLPLKYHLIENKVIINHPIANTLIELTNERIKYFTIGQHFFYKTPHALSNLYKSEQIYAERLLNGRFELWVIHDKKLKPTKKAEDQTANYIEYDLFAGQKNGKWIELNSGQDVLKFCDDKKMLMKEYINKENLDFKKNFDSALIQALKYYISIAD
jgi:hypothetical protein